MGKKNESGKKSAQKCLELYQESWAKNKTNFLKSALTSNKEICAMVFILEI